MPPPNQGPDSMVEAQSVGADPAFALRAEPLSAQGLVASRFNPGEGVSVCPHCGYDLRRDQVFEVGGLRIDPRGLATWRGVNLGLAPAEHIILLSLAKATPRPLSRGALQERTGSESESNVVTRWVCFIRQKLEAAGAPRSLIRSHWGRGYSLEAV